MKARKQFRITIWLLAGVIVSIILHNLINAIFNFKEPFFFLLILIFAISCIVSGVYTFILASREKNN